jgi:hypothetical protein
VASCLALAAAEFQPERAPAQVTLTPRVIQIDQIKCAELQSISRARGTVDLSTLPAVDRFQADDGVRVAICNLVAGGVGLNLTAATYVIFQDLDWVPANHLQAEDRAYRLTVGRGLGRTLDLLRELAAVEPCRGHSFDLLAAHVLEHAQALSGCILVLLRMDEQRRRLVQRLRGLGVQLLVLVTTPEPPGPEEGVTMHAVNPRDVGTSLRALSW